MPRGYPATSSILKANKLSIGVIEIPEGEGEFHKYVNRSLDTLGAEVIGDESKEPEIFVFCFSEALADFPKMAVLILNSAITRASHKFTILGFGLNVDGLVKTFKSIVKETRGRAKLSLEFHESYLGIGGLSFSEDSITHLLLKLQLKKIEGLSLIAPFIRSTMMGVEATLQWQQDRIAELTRIIDEQTAQENAMHVSLLSANELIDDAAREERSRILIEIEALSAQLNSDPLSPIDDAGATRLSDTGLDMGQLSTEEGGVAAGAFSIVDAVNAGGSVDVSDILRIKQTLQKLHELFSILDVLTTQTHQKLMHDIAAWHAHRIDRIKQAFRNRQLLDRVRNKEPVIDDSDIHQSIGRCWTLFNTLNEARLEKNTLLRSAMNLLVVMLKAHVSAAADRHSILEAAKRDIGPQLDKLLGALMNGFHTTFSHLMPDYIFRNETFVQRVLRAFIDQFQRENGLTQQMADQWRARSELDNIEPVSPLEAANDLDKFAQQAIELLMQLADLQKQGGLFSHGVNLQPHSVNVYARAVFASSTRYTDTWLPSQYKGVTEFYAGVEEKLIALFNGPTNAFDQAMKDIYGNAKPGAFQQTDIGRKIYTRIGELRCYIDDLGMLLSVFAYWLGSVTSIKLEAASPRIPEDIADLIVEYLSVYFAELSAEHKKLTIDYATVEVPEAVVLCVSPRKDQRLRMRDPVVIQKGIVDRAALDTLVVTRVDELCEGLAGIKAARTNGDDSANYFDQFREFLKAYIVGNKPLQNELELECKNAIESEVTHVRDRVSSAACRIQGAFRNSPRRMARRGDDAEVAPPPFAGFGGDRA